MTIEKVYYIPELDSVRATVAGIHGDVYTEQIGNGVYLTKTMEDQIVAGCIVEKAKISTDEKQKILDKNGFESVDIKGLIAKTQGNDYED